MSTPDIEEIMTGLEAMPLDTLRDHRNRVDELIERKEEEELNAAREEIIAIATRLGKSAEEILGTIKVKRKVRKPPKPKYRNPDNPDETWSGKGQPPQWLRILEAGGQKRDEFLIKKASE